MSGSQWFSASELALLGLPQVPTTRGKVLDLAARKGWLAPDLEGVSWRRRAARGGGVEFHSSVLWPPAQAALTDRLRQMAPSEPTREDAKRMTERAEAWRWYDTLPAQKKAVAERRAVVLDAIAALACNGVPRTQAMMEVGARNGVRVSTLYAWETLVAGLLRADWLPALAPRHPGAQTRVECPAEAWDMLRSDYLRPERPSFEGCFRRLERVAKQRGWTLPSERTLRRRIEAIPEAVQVAAREGTEALKRLYPAQERTRGHFHALEAINADGHKWDVFVRWPDGEIVRPMMIAFQDLFSGKMLAWRIDKSENKEATRLAFGDVVEEFGIPDKCWLDNGRAFASKWITGGTPNRYRFKIKDDDPLGLLTQLGVAVHWTNPYAGQSKPIERAFKDFAHDTAKHPRFAGAYVGNNPLAKPENYRSAAVPLDVFLATLADAVAEHNARLGRRTAVCQGRSFDDVFAESYAQAPIRRATEPQRRLWLLAAEAIGTARSNGSITLEGNRFWTPFLTDLRGTRVSVRFDPQRLQADLHVYALDGRYLGAAPCIEAVGFDDVEAARAHARARKDWMRAQKMLLAAERKLTIQQVAEMLPETALPVAPERKVVRLVAGNTALAPRDVALPEQDPREARLIAGMRKISLVQKEG